MSKAKKQPINQHFFSAICCMGNRSNAARILGISRESLHYQIYHRKSPLPLSLCKRIEKLSKGRFTVKKLRPLFIIPSKNQE